MFVCICVVYIISMLMFFVFQYMEENKDNSVISICQVAEELRRQYRYYFILMLYMIVFDRVLLRF